MRSTPSVATEILLFTLTLAIMLRTKDLQTLLKPNKTNLILLIALGAVIGPMLDIGKTYESSLPTPLWVPSVFCLLLFAYSIFIELRHRPS
ncbi:MAG TPA: hypothetical protein VJ066_02080 [Candidatus Bathyarchaeia archaeon]|nr:hypothetical protein [Candidatus Bathyarchaeia archaeon]